MWDALPERRQTRDTGSVTRAPATGKQKKKSARPVRRSRPTSARDVAGNQFVISDNINNRSLARRNADNGCGARAADATSVRNIQARCAY